MEILIGTRSGKKIESHYFLFLFLSATISGFSGFATVLMVGATAYIADISKKEERAFRIGEKPTVTRSVAKTKLDKINSISQNF